MPLSDRTKRLLDWWQLRIEKSRKESKENVERNNPDVPERNSNSLGNSNKEEGQ